MNVMKELSLENMEIISGGSWWADGICQGMEIGNVGYGIALELELCASLTGVGAWIVIGVTIGCMAYQHSK